MTKKEAWRKSGGDDIVMAPPEMDDEVGLDAASAPHAPFAKNQVRGPRGVRHHDKKLQHQ
jgi:hypothetical protein